MLMTFTRSTLIGSLLAASLAIATPVLAGPPLLCFPFDISGAKTLPMKGTNWRDVDPKYDVSHLTTDTLALLTPSTPVVVRMETIRRATIYASTQPQQAAALLAALEQRAAQPANAAASVFDFGYLVETYKEAAFMFATPVKGLGDIDGYQLVLKAAKLQGDPGMDFAARTIAQGSRGRLPEREIHLSVDTDGNRLAVPLPRLEHPLLHRLQGVGVEAVDRIERFDDLDLADLSVGEHDRFEENRALDPVLLRFVGVIGVNLGHDLRQRHAVAGLIDGRILDARECDESERDYQFHTTS
jgi:hypothetical protein